MRSRRPKRLVWAGPLVAEKLAGRDVDTCGYPSRRIKAGENCESSLVCVSGGTSVGCLRRRGCRTIPGRRHSRHKLDNLSLRGGQFTDDYVERLNQRGIPQCFTHRAHLGLGELQGHSDVPLSCIAARSRSRSVAATILARDASSSALLPLLVLQTLVSQGEPDGGRHRFGSRWIIQSRRSMHDDRTWSVGIDHGEPSAPAAYFGAERPRSST
jgi:hypothetical protein